MTLAGNGVGDQEKEMEREKETKMDGDENRSWKTVEDRKRKIETDAKTLMDDVLGLREDISEVFPFAEKVRTKPYAYLLGAAGVGFVLGGGLTSKITTRLMMFAFFRLGIPMAKTALMDVLFRGEERAETTETGGTVEMVEEMGGE